MKCLVCNQNAIGMAVFLIEDEAQRAQGKLDDEDYWAFQEYENNYTTPAGDRLVVIHPIHVVDIIQEIMKGEHSTIFRFMYGSVADIFGED